MKMPKWISNWLNNWLESYGSNQDSFEPYDPNICHSDNDRCACGKTAKEIEEEPCSSDCLT